MKKQDYEQLTLFQEDSPASHFPWLESKKVKGTSVTCGRKCSELSEKLSRVGSWVRTYLESCDLPGPGWSRTWSVKDTTLPCLLLRLRLSERRTDGNASPLWPTVRSHEVGDYQYDHGDKSKKRLTLTGAAKTHNPFWPTPRASEYKGCGPIGSKSAEAWNKQGYLTARVLYATPNARDWKSATAAEWDNPNRSRDLNRQIAKLSEGGTSTEERNGQLNPTWVEWLMGFPLGWTDLNASETP